LVPEDFLALLELLRADKVHPVVAERTMGSTPGRMMAMPTRGAAITTPRRNRGRRARATQRSAASAPAASTAGAIPSV
jgi:hypothetical protein